MRRILGVSLLLCGLVFVMGSVRPSGYADRGYSGGYGDGYAQQGAFAWDTVTVLFTMDSTYTSAAAGDTHQEYLHNYWVQNADQVYILGTGNDVPDFAYGNVDSADANGYFNYRYIPLYPSARLSGSNPGALDIRFNFPANRKSPLLYIPFEDYIPRNSTIVSAKMNVRSWGTTYDSKGDTAISVLMTNASDNKWYTSKGIAKSTGYPNYAHASWRRQISTNGGDVDWAATNSDDWSPRLEDRQWPWEFGDHWDYSGMTYSGNVPAGTTRSYSLLNCVQGAVNGATNNGIIMIGADISTTTPSLTWGMFGWDEDATSANQSPWIVVKYITKKYQPYFGSAEWALMLETDDAVYSANSIYADTAAVYGAVMTMYACEDFLDGVDRSTAAQLVNFRDNYGFEVGTHSRYHFNTPPLGFLNWEAGDTNSAAWDSLLFDMSPYWLYDQAEAVDGNSRINDIYWGKSLALPNNVWDPYVLLGAYTLGYESMRTNPTESPVATIDYRYRSLAYWREAVTDSGFVGVTYDHGRRPRNMMLAPYTMSIIPIVGPKANNTDLDSLKHNMKRAIAHVIGDGRKAMRLFWHDDKAGGYSEGMDYDEFGALLQVSNEMGARYMRASEYARWMKNNATAVPTPDAYSQADSFKFSESDRIWFVPHGVDQTPIRGVRPAADTYSYDTTAPTTPSGLLAIAGDGQVVLSWTGATDKSTVTYNVYRFFEGSADTTLIASKVYNTFYSDTGAMNGTEHFYFVSASDLAENESYDSGVASDTPLGTLSLVSPAYYALWYQDPDAVSPTAAQYDSLAAFDMVVAGALSLNGDASEPFYAGMKDSLVARNSDIVVLSYAMAVTPRTDWGSYPAGSAQKRTWDFLSAVADSNGFGKNTSGVVVRSNAYPTLFTNIMTAAYADTIARYWVDALNGSGMDGAYSGFFVDLADSSLADWICNVGGPCTSLMDFDQDATAYGSDADEKAAYKAFQLAFTKALRREFAENGMADRLIVHNGDYARNNASVAKYVDGFMWEGWNVYVPGAQGSEAVWEATIAKRDLLVNAQTNPPLVLYDANADSSHAFITEPLSLAYGGLTGVQNTGDGSGNDAIPAMVRRLPNPGAISSYDAANDTLVVTAANYTARLDINHTAADSFTVWPYFIVSGTDTLSRGGGWPRQIIAPLLTDAEAFDASISISWDENQLYGIPGYDRTEVYRSTSSDSATMTLFDYGKQIGEYWNVNVPNDSTYYYSLKNTDVWGQRSTFSDIVPLTPSDLETLFLTFAVASPDPPDTTDSGSLSADVSATLTRDVFVKPMFRRHDGGYADWADTSSTFWLNPAATDWSAFYDTGIPVANAAEDSGGIRVTWDAGTGQSGYLLQMSANGDSWVTVDGSVSADSTGFTHAASASPPPRRGELRYRLYGYNADPDTTAVATHDSLFYNQAVRVYGKFLAIADTNAAHTGIIESPEQSVVYISYPAPAGPDTDPPDTTGVFAGVVADTSDTDNVILTLSDMTLDEIGQVQFQWSEDSGTTWLDAEEWNPTNPSVTVGDTIHTLASTAEVAALNVYTRFRLRDDEGTPNVSGWSENTQAFTRMSPSATDTIGYSDTAYDDSRDITGLFSYGARIVMTESGSITKASAYLTVATGDYSIKAALYTDDGANRGDLVAEGLLTVSSGGATGWHEVTFDAPYAATGGEDFYIFFKGNDTSPVLFNFDYETAGTPELSWYRSTAWASFPDDPISPGSTYNDRRFAAYLEYE